MQYEMKRCFQYAASMQKELLITLTFDNFYGKEVARGL